MIYKHRQAEMCVHLASMEHKALSLQSESLTEWENSLWPHILLEMCPCNMDLTH
jgi:hypothetical protein